MRLLSKSYVLICLILILTNLIVYIGKYYFFIIPIITIFDIILSLSIYSIYVLAIFIVGHFFLSKHANLSSKGLILINICIVLLHSVDFYFKAKSDMFNMEVIKELRQSKRTFFTTGHSLIRDNRNRLLIKKICQIKNSKSQFFIDYYKVDCEMFKSK